MAGRYQNWNKSAGPRNTEPVQIGNYGKIPRELFNQLTGRRPINVRTIDVAKGAVNHMGYFGTAQEIIISTWHSAVSVKVTPSGMFIVSGARDGNMLKPTDRFVMGAEIDANIPSLPTPLQHKTCEEGKVAGMPEMSVAATVQYWLNECNASPAAAAANSELMNEVAQLKALIAQLTGQPVAAAPAAPAAPAAAPAVTVKPEEASKDADEAAFLAAAGAAAGATGPGPNVDELRRMAGSI